MLEILVTGADGQLGRSLRRLGAAGANRYTFTDVAELDITDADAVRRQFGEHRYDVVINCAAYTNVERAEADEEGGGAGDVAQAGDDGDGGAFPGEDRAAGVDLAEDVLGDAGDGGVDGEAEAGLVAGDLGELDGEAAGAVLLEVGLEALPDVGGGLVGHKAAGELGEGVGGDDGLGARAAVAAVDAVHLDGGAEGVADDGGDAALAADGEDADLVAVGVLVEAALGGEGELGLGGVDDVVAEALDGDGAVGVVQGGDELGDALGGVGGQAAVLAGVEVVLRAPEGDGEVDDAAQAGDDGRAAGGVLAGVGDEEDVGGEAAAEVEGLLGEEAAAALLLALEDDADGGETLAVLDGGAETLEEGEPLALVVLRAAGVDAAVALGGLEGRGLPEVDGVDGLDVVVAVEEDGAAGGVGGTFGEDQRGLGAVAADELGGEAQGAEEGAHPLGAGDAVGQVGGVTADGGETQEGVVVGEDGDAVGREPGVEGGLGHGAILSWVRRRSAPTQRSWARAQAKRMCSTRRSEPEAKSQSAAAESSERGMK